MEMKQNALCGKTTVQRLDRSELNHRRRARSLGAFLLSVVALNLLAATPTTEDPRFQIYVRPGGVSAIWQYGMADTPDPAYPGLYPVASIKYYDVPDPGFEWILTRGYFQYSTDGGNTWQLYPYNRDFAQYTPVAGKVWRFVDTSPGNTTTVENVGVSWFLQGIASPISSGTSIRPDNPPTDVTSKTYDIWGDVTVGGMITVLGNVDTGLTSGGVYTIDAQSVPNLFVVSSNRLIRGTANVPTPGQTATVTVRYSDRFQLDGSGVPLSGQGASRTFTFTVRSNPSGFGDDIRVNTFTDNAQATPAIARLSDGNYVCVWRSVGQGGESTSYGGIYGQIFTPAGSKVNGEFAVSPAGNNTNEITPSVAALEGGKFVVAYGQTVASSDNNIVFRVIQANGTVGPEVTAPTSSTGSQTAPGVAALAGGGFVIAWASPNGGDTGDILTRCFLADGSPIAGSQLTVNTTTNGSQTLPAVAALANGNYVVAWRDPANGGDVRSRVLNSSGAVSGEIVVATGATLQTTPRVAGLSSGFVVTWQESGRTENGVTDTSGQYNIYANRFDNSGVVSGSTFLVNANVLGTQISASPCALSGGGFLVTWQSDSDMDGSLGIFGRRFDSAGVAADAYDFQVNKSRENAQSVSSAVGMANDGFAAVWADAAIDGESNSGVVTRILSNTPGDTTPPTVESVVRKTPSQNIVTAGPVVLEVTFSEDVANVSGSAFQITTVAGTALGSVASVNGGPRVYEVTVSLTGGPGEIRLDVPTAGTPVIQDAAANALVGLPFTAGETYFYAPNQPPTGIHLSSASVNASAGPNATVGTLTTTDPDSGDSFTYSLVSGDGSADNSLFNIFGNTLRLSNPSGLLPGAYSVRIQTEDGHGGTFADSFLVTLVDDVPPSVSSVNSITPNGVYGVGEIVRIRIFFTENVIVTGSPTLAMATGVPGRAALYLSGSGSATLTFQYVVQPGDNSMDLDYASAGALTGGTLKDAMNNDAVRTLPAPGSPNSLGFNKVLVLDGTAFSPSGLAILNHNFEIDGLDEGLYSTGVIPTGWSPYDLAGAGYYGYLNPTAGLFTGAAGNSAAGTMDGPNVFYFGSAVSNQGIQQALANLFLQDTDYILTVAVGSRFGSPNTASLKMELLAGNEVFASSTVLNSTPDSFVDFSLRYSATPVNNHLAGMPLTIRFTEVDPAAGLYELDIDNVRVDAFAQCSLSLTSSINSSSYGDLVEFVANVTSGAGVPVGTVDFYAGDSHLGSALLSGGQASLITPLDVGVHSITATYAGSGRFGASTNSVTHTVNPAPTYSSTSTYPGHSVYGEPVLIEAYIYGTHEPIAGDVIIRDGTNELATLSTDKGGWVYLVTSALGAGIHTISVEYPGSARFLGCTNAAQAIVDKANPSLLALPTSSAITYGQPLAASTLNGGIASVPGRYQFQIPATVPSAGPYPATIDFIPDDTTNFNIVQDVVVVMINRATPVISSWPTAGTLVFGQTLAHATLVGGEATNTLGNFAFATPATQPNAGTYTATVIFQPFDTANFESVTGSVVVQVEKADSVIEPWPIATPITYGQALATSTLLGGGIYQAGTFSFDLPATVPSAGTYTAAVTFTPADPLNYNAAKGTVSVLVEKATPVVTVWPATSEITYGQTLADSLFTGGSPSVAGKFEFATPAEKPNAGIYPADVVFHPDDSENYNNVNGMVPVMVARATPVVTTWATASEIVYGQSLADSVLSGGDTSVKGAFSFAVPSATPVAGTHVADVTFQPSDSSNYNSVQGVVPVMVAKATPTVLPWPDAGPITFGETVGSSALTGGAASVPGAFTFAAPATTPSAGPFSAEVVFTPADSDNYRSVNGSIVLAVHKAAPVVTAWPTASAITFGEALADSTLSGGVSSVPGNFAFDAPGLAPNAGAYVAAVSFTPSDTANYLTVDGSAEVLVSKATPVVIAWPMPSDITYNETVSASELVGGTASVSGTFSYENPTVAPAAGAFVAAVTFTPKDTSNYEQVQGTVTLLINKATPVVSTWPTATDITYGDEVSAASLVGGESSIPGQFSFDAPNALPGAGSFAAPVTFTPGDAANYNSVKGTVNIVVSQATPVISAWPAASGITYGDNLGNSTLTGGSGSVPGEFTFDNPTATMNAGTHSVSVTFTPMDTANYRTVIGSVVVLVNKANPTVAHWPTACEISYGTRLSLATLAGGNASVPGSFAYSSPSMVPSAGTYSAKVVFTPTDSDNYTEVIGAINVTVTRGTPMVWVWPQATRLAYGQRFTDCALNAGDASVPGTFVFDPYSVPTTRLAAGVHPVPVVFNPADSLNYNSITGYADVTVDPAPLRLVVASRTRLGGEPNPELAATLEGLVSGDEVTVTCETSANESSAPGRYPITTDLRDPESKLVNYTLTTIEGWLTVLPQFTSTKEAGVYVLGGEPVLVDPNAQVEEASGLNFGGGVLRVSVSVGGCEEDQLSVQSPEAAIGQIGVSGSEVTFGGASFGTVTGGQGTNPLVVSLNTNATCAALNALLHQLTFATTATNTDTRTIEVALVMDSVTVGLRRDLLIDRAPTATDDDILASTEIVFTIPHSTLLANDNDPDGDDLRLTLEYTNSVAGASLRSETNHIIYTATPGHQGQDRFLYRVEDGRGGCDVGTVTIRLIQHQTLQLPPENISDEGARISMGGTPGRTYQIEASTDLLHWIVIDTVTATPTGIIEILDAEARRFPQRFYRALSR